jgi:hypothetical protein
VCGRTALPDRLGSAILVSGLTDEKRRGREHGGGPCVWRKMVSVGGYLFTEFSLSSSDLKAVKRSRYYRGVVRTYSALHFVKLRIEVV